jgi:pimeloyl-ACP methyl ester carboxylesterase
VIDGKERQTMTYVLIPGAGGVALYWHLVQDELRRRGHESIAVELPSGDAGFTEYASAVVDAAANLTDVTLVAQSMGGFTAPLVAERRPIERIIFVNAMIPRVGETAGEWWGNTGQEQARRANDTQDGRDPDAEFDLDTYFLHDLPEDERQTVLTTDRPQSGNVFEQPYPLKSWPETPMHVITATGDRFFPAKFQRRVSQERLGITPDEIPGGHLVALNQPVALTELILRYR